MNIANRDRSKPSVFFAGTIDNGNSEDWQTQLSNWLEFSKWNIFNPRRKEWDSSWAPTIENPNFSQQVNWEINAINQSDIVLFYFMPESKSPVTMLEFGYCAGKGIESVVCCPDEFWRSGNVHFMCSQFDIQLVKDFAGLNSFCKKWRELRDL